MSELRQDMVSEEWVIFAENRKDRPYEFVHRKIEPKTSCTACAFCPGHEEETPKAVYQNGPDGAWDIRVFENRYPAVHSKETAFLQENFYTNAPGIGRHEVLVDTPSHFGHIRDFSKEHLQQVMKVLQMRYESIRAEKETAYVQVFKNCGPEAGASIAHSHWQLIGMPVLGKAQQDTLRVGQGYLKQHGRCLFCDMINKEKTEAVRVVAENEAFVAFTPYASRSSYELWLMPKDHVATFSELTENQRDLFADLLGQVIEGMMQLKDRLGFNICFQDAPKDREDGFHWYCRLLPRIGAPAGFEFGTGNHINPVLPERAAKTYRRLVRK